MHYRKQTQVIHLKDVLGHSQFSAHLALGVKAAPSTKGSMRATSPIGSIAQRDTQFYQKTFLLGLWQVRDFSGFPSENRKQLAIALPRMFS